MPRQGPDTHEVAVQASAAKLIKLLHEAYPGISQFLDSNAESAARLAQASLLGYLETLLNPEAGSMGEKERELAPKNSNIKGTIQFIEYVNQLPLETLNAEAKQSIFAQLKVIASRYPGGVWDDQQQQWSINRFYNKDTQAIETIMTPPAVALNLVCTALFDKTRYLSSDAQWEQDLALRLITVYEHLLALRRQTAQGQLEKCSAGLQHDLLYFLNGSYLGANGKPIELLMDTESFLLNSLSTFVEQHIHERWHEPTTQRMVLAWMHWATEGSDEQINPMISWLGGVFPSTNPDADAGWKEACTKYMIERCKDFGLNPQACPLAAYIETLPEIPVVVSEETISPVVAEILQMGRLAIAQSNYPSDSLYHLIHLRNEVLSQFKGQVNLEITSSNIDGVKNLFCALTFVNGLYRYRDFSLLVGAEDTQFHERLNLLKTLLLDYFRDYSLAKTLPTQAFETCRSDYLMAEQEFLKQNNIPFIENFFALMDGRKGTWDNAWGRLEVLNGDAATHSLVLSDEALIAWQQQSQSITADGTTVVDITPYAINRLLLQGLLVRPQNWSPLYSHYLSLVTNWLLEPAAPGQGLLSQVKKNYPTSLLINLRFISVVHGSTLEAALKERIYQLIPSPWELSYLGINLLLRFFYLSLQHLNEAQRTQILTAVEGQFATLIKSGWQLLELFQLSPAHLNEAQRTQILSAVEGRLAALIKNGSELLELFLLSPEKLNEAQRTQLLSAVEGRLATLIEDVWQLCRLFQLLPEQLNEAQRTQIWSAVEGRLATLIKNGNEFYQLFKLSAEQLNAAQRAQIWRAVEGQLATLIKNGSQLCQLFQLSAAQLNAAQRAQILSAVEGRLATLIKNRSELLQLFQLSPEQLNAAQRTQILTAVEGQFATLIINHSELLQLFQLSPEQLNEAQRTQIWAAVEGQLATLIKNGWELLKLFQLSPEQLNEAQRAQIWATVDPQVILISSLDELILWLTLSPQKLDATKKAQMWNAVKDNLVNLINNSEDLFRLLCVGPQFFNETHTADIWSVVKDKLAMLIKNGSNFCQLFQYLSAQFNKEQRAEMWTVVESQLEILISDVDVLTGLLALSPEQLNAAQRAKIWSAVEGQLEKLIISEEEFKRLFQLSKKCLNEAQRAQILNVWRKSPRLLGLHNDTFFAGYLSTQNKKEPLSSDEAKNLSL